MIDLHQRSTEKELMDGENIPMEAMEQTLKELNLINTRLGGHAITLQGLKQFISQKEPLVICEIGCGGGDNLFAIHKYCIKKKIPVTFIGIDMNIECISFAKKRYPQLPCQWICSDYAVVHFGDNKPDVVFSSLFCHHFRDDQLVPMLQWLKQNSKKGFFINDLQRHWLAWFLIKWLTRFFSKSYLVRNDACLSVARSFQKKDWEKLFRLAGINFYRVSWKWAFRWLVVANGNHPGRTIENR
jgi:2-polyprenyl-3-methyl-5-hydroxy-6-metoxy-1,4-benzoquinol methylase